MVWVKMGNEEEKKKVMEEKWRLGKRRVWIENNRTERGRSVIWMARRMAEKEMKDGKKVNVGYMKL